MKKILCAIIAVLMLGTGAYAKSEMPFVSQMGNYFVRADGSLYINCWSNRSASYIRAIRENTENISIDSLGINYINKDMIFECEGKPIEVVNGFLYDGDRRFYIQDAAGNTYYATPSGYTPKKAICEFVGVYPLMNDGIYSYMLMGDNNTLYLVVNEYRDDVKFVPIAENVKDYYSEKETIGTYYYRDFNDNLYVYNNRESKLLLENCSEIYRHFYAKTKDGQWYYFGEGMLKIALDHYAVRKIEDLPIDYKEPRNPLTEELYRGHVYDRGFEISYSWRTDGCLIFEGKIVDTNVLAVSGNIFVSLDDGTLWIFNRYAEPYGYKFEVGIDPMNFFKQYSASNGSYLTLDGNIATLSGFGGLPTSQFVADKYLYASDWAVAEITDADNGVII